MSLYNLPFKEPDIGNFEAIEVWLQDPVSIEQLIQSVEKQKKKNEKISALEQKILFQWFEKILAEDDKGSFQQFLNLQLDFEDFNAPTHESWAHAAIAYHAPQCLALCFEKDLLLNIHSRTPKAPPDSLTLLEYATQISSTAVVDFLLQNSDDRGISYEKKQLITLAINNISSCFRGSYSFLDYFLAQGFSPYSKDNTQHAIRCRALVSLEGQTFQEQQEVFSVLFYGLEGWTTASIAKCLIQCMNSSSELQEEYGLLRAIYNTHDLKPGHKVQVRDVLDLLQNKIKITKDKENLEASITSLSPNTHTFKPQKI